MWTIQLYVVYERKGVLRTTDMAHEGLHVPYSSPAYFQLEQIVHWTISTIYAQRTQCVACALRTYGSCMRLQQVHLCWCWFCWWWYLWCWCWVLLVLLVLGASRGVDWQLRHHTLHCLLNYLLPTLHWLLLKPPPPHTQHTPCIASSRISSLWAVDPSSFLLGPNLRRKHVKFCLPISIYEFSKVCMILLTLLTSSSPISDFWCAS